MPRLFLLAALGALAPAAALAQPATVTADARCLLAMAAFSSSAADPRQKELGQLGVVFYAGRITRIDPAYDFPVELRRLEPGMDLKAIQAEAKRCGPPVVQMLQKVSASFPHKAPPPATPKPAPKP